MRIILSIISVFLMFLTPSFAAQVPDTDTIPKELESWRPWVLHGEEKQFCPTSYNNGEEYRCMWPSSLTLDLDQRSGRFTQQWQVFLKGWVQLPGGKKQWPLNVTVDEKAVPVVDKDGSPSVYLRPGEHRVDGVFVWDEMPEMIRVPNACGLVGLSINQKTVDFPLLDNQGRLWLQKRESPAQEERVDIRVCRLITDSIPMNLVTRLKINVSGRPREIKVKGILFDRFIPLTIESPIPARLGPEGILLIQARPGQWDIRFKARSEGPIEEIKPGELFYGEEIWAFQSQNHLRMVKVSGVIAIDPTQADLPDEWKNFPSYIVNSNDQMAFQEIRRGDPDPAPDQINLNRTWWLDFDGRGFAIRDNINGTMSRQWYLAMNPPAILGRVSVDGQDQLITSQGKDGKPGVELRRGSLNLIAESRFEASTGKIPAVGWDHDFQSVSGSLNLPPGWRLFTASGVDVMPGTWFSQWTLLDLFLVLIISLSIYKLWSWPWAVLSLAALGLTYHEPEAPRLVWLNILASIAILRIIPEGWMKKLVNIWCLASLISVIVLAIPFMINQVRWGIYPQLEPHAYQGRTIRAQQAGYVGDIATSPEETAAPSAVVSKKMRLNQMRSESVDSEWRDKEAYAPEQTLMAQDPNALIQTGPGLPRWQWRSYAMKWNGPVERSQQVCLRLLGPGMNLFLAFTRVILLAFLIIRVIGFRKWKMPAVEGSFTFQMVLIWMLLIPTMSMGAMSMGAAGETKPTAYPPTELLEGLKKRLLEKPDCLPDCADSPQMKLTVRPNDLEILYKVHAAIETAVPLPGSLESWSPAQVLLDSRPATGLIRDKDGTLWLLVPEGIHTATLLGNTPAESSFQILLPLKPQKVIFENQGWEVQGISEEGRVEGGINLIRQKGPEEASVAEPARTLPPFLHVERVISLGLNWQVFTTVTRLTPVGAPIVVSIPLVDGESVTTAGVTIEKSMAQINMGPNEKRTAWKSTLKTIESITLRAPRSVPWAETWILDASPIWHCDFAGIPVVHHQDPSGQWRPQWEPWPGEEVKVSVIRPKAIPGQLVTIDSANLTLTPGQRFGKADLSMDIRSSQGGQHNIGIPLGAKLQWIKINGQAQPIREQDNSFTIPLRPGSQTVEVEWHQDGGLSLLTKAPKVLIGEQAVNADVIFQMPDNRWILFAHGPLLGPAVLFWSYLLVMVIVATFLGRINWTPLKPRDWLLLGLGVTQVPPLAAVMIVGWLLALGSRAKYLTPTGGRFTFNMGQVLLVIWSLAAMVGLYVAIQRGLLGIPNMQIAGNGSSDFWLHWTQDRIGSLMPAPVVLTLPLLFFRILMLLWALWLAYSLLKWLRWGWQCFSEGGLWRKGESRKRGKPDAKDVSVSGEKTKQSI